jgi:hypothetical protein
VRMMIEPVQVVAKIVPSSWAFQTNLILEAEHKAPSKPSKRITTSRSINFLRRTHLTERCLRAILGSWEACWLSGSPQCCWFCDVAIFNSLLRFISSFSNGFHSLLLRPFH